MYPRYLGIDPGTGKNNCGWGVVEGDDSHPFELIGYGTIQLAYNPSFGRKLTVIAGAVVDLIEQHKVNIMCCETFFAGRFTRFGASRIPELRGVLQHYADIYNLPFIDIAPTSMKKIVTGSGKGDKKDIIQNICSRFNIDKPISDHEADAIGISLAGAYMELNKDA